MQTVGDSLGNMYKEHVTNAQHNSYGMMSQTMCSNILLTIELRTYVLQIFYAVSPA